MLVPLVAASGKSLHAFQQFLPGERHSHTGLGVRREPRLEDLTVFARRAIPNAPDSSRELTDHLELAPEPPAEDAQAKMNADRKTRRKRQPVILSLREQFGDSFTRHRLVFLVYRSFGRPRAGHERHHVREGAAKPIVFQEVPASAVPLPGHESKVGRRCALEPYKLPRHAAPESPSAQWTRHSPRPFETFPSLSRSPSRGGPFLLGGNSGSLYRVAA